MKKLLSAVTVASAMALVVSTGSAVHAADKQLNIQMVSKGFQHQFWQAVKLGAEQAGKALNAKINFVGPPTEQDTQIQLDQLTAAINTPGVDAIGYASLDPVIPQAALKAAQAKKIPVMFFDAQAGSDLTDRTDGGLSLGLAATDGYLGSALAADKMAAAIGGKGKVFVIAHSEVNATAVQRRSGFIDEMKKKFPKVTVLPVQVGDGDHQKSADIVKAVMAANKDLKGVFATNEGGAEGACLGFQEIKAKKGAVKLVGFDSGDAQMKCITDGYMLGAITQDPIGIGYKTVAALVAKVRNGTNPKTFINTGFYWYNASNMTDPKIAAVLYH